MTKYTYRGKKYSRKTSLQVGMVMDSFRVLELNCSDLSGLLDIPCATVYDTIHRDTRGKAWEKLCSFYDALGVENKGATRLEAVFRALGQLRQ